MANELPVGGVTIDQVQPQYRQWFIDAANTHGVPLTFLLNIYGAESSLGTNIANSPAARGIMQIGDTTAQRYGINALDPQSSIFGAAKLFGQYIDKYRDPYLAAMAYNWGEGDPNNPSPVKGLLAYQTRGWGAVPEETLRYVDNVMRGVGPSPVGLRDEIARRLYGMPEAGDRVFDVPLPGPRQFDPLSDIPERLEQGPGGLLGQPAPWDLPGIISPEYGHYLQTQGLMPANLMPSGGTDFTNTTWDAPAGSQPGWWGPWGAESVHNWAQEGISHGYDQPIMNLLGNLNYNLVDPGLAAGPGNAPLGGAPLAATGGVDLAHWMAQQWGTGWGNVGADRPQSWHDQWDPNISSGPSSNRGGNVWDASPRQETWAAHPDLTFWDASTPFSRGEPGVHVIEQPAGPQPAGGGGIVWNPAPGGWGTGDVSLWAGGAELNQSGNPNNWLFNPAANTWGTFGGGTGNQVQDYNQWYEDVIGGVASQPSTGFNQGTGFSSIRPMGTFSGPGYAAANPSPTATATGLGYQGSSGLTNAYPAGEINLANAIGAGQYQNYYANMNAASHYSPIAAYPGPVVYNNPQIQQNYATPATNSGQIFGGQWTQTPLAVGNTAWF